MRGMTAAWLLVGLLGVRCVPLARHVRPGEKPLPNEVVLVGRALFDPPLYPGDKPTVTSIDPGGYLSQLLIQFTYPGIKGEEDVVIGVEPGAPFAVAVPRRPLTLRLLRMYLRSYNPQPHR